MSIVMCKVLNKFAKKSIDGIKPMGTGELELAHAQKLVKMYGEMVEIVSKRKVKEVAEKQTDLVEAVKEAEALDAETSK